MFSDIILFNGIILFSDIKRGDNLGKSKDYEEKARKMLLPIVRENNFELVDVEYVKEGGNNILRAYIDKEGGITLDDCELVNRTMSDLLDKNDIIDDSYTLEISSPGLGRTLKKPQDFIWAIGKDVDIKLFKSITVSENGKSVSAKEFTGRLDGYDGDTVSVFLGEETRDIPCSDIAKIRISIDF